MTRDPDQDFAASRHAEIIEELRSLVRRPVTSSEELQQLRDHAATERVDTQQRVLEAIAEKAGVDLRSILDDARDARRRGHEQIAEALTRLDAEANHRANQEKVRLHRIREQYRDVFQGQVAGPGSSTQMKFRDVVHSYGEPIAPPCAHLDTSIWHPTIGPDVAVTADISPSTDSPGTWLHPRIDIVARSCDRMDSATTFQELMYGLDAPATSFGVENVRVDLVANGIFRSQLGDPQGWFTDADPLYYHTHVGLSVAITQEIGGEAQTWPLLDEELFRARGNVNSTQIRSALSGQTYPHNFFVRGANTGGGALHCMVQISCSTMAIGSGASVLLDFGAAAGHGIFVGGVALLGSFL
jgi:hypothetical protein